MYLVVISALILMIKILTNITVVSVPLETQLNLVESVEGTSYLRGAVLSFVGGK